MQLPTLNLREMAVLTIQGKLGFLVLMKNQLRLNPKDQSMKLDAFLMTPLKEMVSSSGKKHLLPTEVCSVFS